MNYPNGGTPPTTTFETAQHVVARQALAFTGTDIFGWVVAAVLLIVFGLLLAWACRIGWRNLG